MHCALAHSSIVHHVLLQFSSRNSQLCIDILIDFLFSPNSVFQSSGPGISSDFNALGYSIRVDLYDLSLGVTDQHIGAFSDENACSLKSTHLFVLYFDLSVNDNVFEGIWQFDLDEL